MTGNTSEGIESSSTFYPSKIKQNHMESIYKIQLHALLLDCIIHSRHKMHMSRNSASFKAQFCRMIGISPRTTSVKMIEVLRDIYAHNGMTDKFENTIAKFK